MILSREHEKRCEAFLIRNGWHEKDGGWVSHKLDRHFAPKKCKLTLTLTEALFYEAGLSAGKKDGLVMLN